MRRDQNGTGHNGVIPGMQIGRRSCDNGSSFSILLTTWKISHIRL